MHIFGIYATSAIKRGVFCGLLNSLGRAEGEKRRLAESLYPHGVYGSRFPGGLFSLRSGRFRRGNPSHRPRGQLGAPLFRRLENLGSPPEPNCAYAVVTPPGQNDEWGGAWNPPTRAVDYLAKKAKKNCFSRDFCFFSVIFLSIFPPEARCARAVNTGIDDNRSRDNNNKKFNAYIRNLRDFGY